MEQTWREVTNAFLGSGVRPDSTIWRDAIRSIPMTFAKVEAFFTEFPFLHRYWNPAQISSASVMRWNDELLRCDGTVCAYGDYFSETIFVLDEEGSVLLKFPGLLARLRSFLELIPGRSPTFFEALKKLKEDELKKAFWAVRLEYTLKRPPLILFKIPQGYASVYEWLASEVKKEQSLVKN
jgi:hypothetical protein